MQGFICVIGVLELPVFVTLRPGFWQFSPMRTRRPAGVCKLNCVTAL
ncbi:hypothetical protein [Xanthomonas oryzae]|uniref:IS1478 transposase n=2 Tax=Xanthomonas oryzae pv. oryzae TaxID=64187 RepID=Q5H4T0_XANOR|nr:hypothetical protein [Xanthomonas oryzae]AAW74040.1 IS1478 transposase [Xanthomonas oryzae pv. oryzae KACC 10331]ACD61052.1 hypothetical protein PXO_03163 [Xanthomonas oryzae pv. oryzae PXO99A]AXQ08187.1 transposase [Xanthomonas oryzae pv. oryzae]UNE62218.1 hypothetical protein MML47_18615 [Xanthomonas oryzae]